MAKYTIGVDGIYALSILAPLAELVSEHDDQGYMEDDMHRTLGCLLSELMDWGGLKEVGEHPDEWEKIANYLDRLAGMIRKNLKPEQSNG